MIVLSAKFYRKRIDLWCSQKSSNSLSTSRNCIFYLKYNFLEEHKRSCRGSLDKGGEFDSKANEIFEVALVL